MNMQQSSTFSLRKTRTVEIHSLKRQQILLSLPKSPFQSLISVQGTLNTGVKNSEMFNEIEKPSKFGQQHPLSALMCNV